MIALFTDFGTQDVYVAQLKGAIVSIAPHAAIFDLNHHVGQFAISQAAYLLAASTRYWPAGSIIVAVVDPGVGTARRPVVLETQAQRFYVGPDNGLFTHVILQEGVRGAYELQQKRYFRARISATFHGRDIFAPVAAHLACGVPPSDFGPPLPTLQQLPVSHPWREDHKIYGEVIHIDHFGNVITNITKEFLGTFLSNGQVECMIANQSYIMPFLRTYGDAAARHLCCLINSNDEFEIALPQGHAASYMQVHVGAPLTVTVRLAAPPHGALAGDY